MLLLIEAYLEKVPGDGSSPEYLASPKHQNLQYKYCTVYTNEKLANNIKCLHFHLLHSRYRYLDKEYSLLYIFILFFVI
jgi:hypothetical protein